MYFDHAFIRAFSHDFIDCRIYTNRLPHSSDYVIAADYDYYVDILQGNGIKRFCDYFKPKLGDEIHLVPDSAYAVQDVRNNYKLKRKFDEGVCNVFSPIPTTGKRVKICYDSLYYNKEKNIVCLICKESKTDTRSDVARQMSALCGFDINSNDIWYGYTKSIVYYRVNESYINLLTNNHIKPCIYYDDLDMNRNKLTLDQLCVLYESSRAQSSTENIKNYCVQLSSLAQSDWKEYPGTMHYILKEIIRWNRTHYDISRYLSAYPKQIREIYNYKFDNRDQFFSTEKDRSMISGFLEYILNIGECRFATVDQLLDKLSATRISTELFNKFYNTMTKITPKRNEEYGNSIYGYFFSDPTRTFSS